VSTRAATIFPTPGDAQRPVKLMSKPTGLYPLLTVDTTAKRVVSQAGAVLLVATAGKVGLDRALSAALAPWRKRWAVLDPGRRAPHLLD